MQFGNAVVPSDGESKRGRENAMDDALPNLATILTSCPKCLDGTLQLISVGPDPEGQEEGVRQAFYACRDCNFTGLRRWRPRRR